MRLFWLAIIIFFFSQGLLAQVRIDCTFKYRINTSTDIRICSYEQLSNYDLAFVSRIVSDTPRIYAKYSGRNMLAVDRLDIAILSREAMNDGTLPQGLNPARDVVGRYYPGDRRVYIVLDAIRNREPILSHEIVHYLNYRYGVVDLHLDEKLAYAFESFLVSQ